MKTIFSDGNSAFAITTDGKLYAWGSNWRGKLGNGSTSNSSNPKEILAGTTFKTVALVNGSTFGITTDDKPYAWGGNSSGQLGDGSTSNSSSSRG